MGTWVPVQVNFTAYQGADFSDCILLKDPDSVTVPPAPLPLPWTHARIQLREDFGMPVLIDLTDVLDANNSGIVLTGVDGKIEIRIDAKTTEALTLFGEPLVMVYDLVCFDDNANPRVDRVAQGFFILSPECSRAATP